MTLALGVDVSAERGLDLVFLDERRRLSGPALRHQTAEDLFRRLVEREPDVVAIDSPPRLGTNGRSRSCERELLRLRLHCYFTRSYRGVRSKCFRTRPRSRSPAAFRRGARVATRARSAAGALER
jgi:predicted nuclease with RNAse H fold